MQKSVVTGNVRYFRVYRDVDFGDASRPWCADVVFKNGEVHYNLGWLTGFKTKISLEQAIRAAYKNVTVYRYKSLDWG